MLQAQNVNAMREVMCMQASMQEAAGFQASVVAPPFVIGPGAAYSMPRAPARFVVYPRVEAPPQLSLSMRQGIATAPEPEPTAFHKSWAFSSPPMPPPIQRASTANMMSPMPDRRGTSPPPGPVPRPMGSAWYTPRYGHGTPGMSLVVPGLMLEAGSLGSSQLWAPPVWPPGMSGRGMPRAVSHRLPGRRPSHDHSGRSSLQAPSAPLGPPQRPVACPTEAKLRQWLGHDAGPGEREWDDGQILKIVDFAQEQGLEESSAEEIYRQYVFHQVELADSL